MFFRDREEYEDYLRQNEIEDYEIGKDNYFEWNEDGYILLQRNKFTKSARDMSYYTNCETWVLLNDKVTMALIKYPFGDKYRNLSIDEYYKSIYNNILLPQISKQFQNESAKYFLAKKDNKGKKQRVEQTYILTKDFKRKNEELIHGEEILEENNADIRELNIDVLIKNIEIYLKRENFNNVDIERIRREFIKQSLDNRFKKQVDENNHNWGIIVNNRFKTARIAPMYDLDCCCEMGKLSKHRRMTNDGSLDSLESIVNQYKNEEWFKKYLEEVMTSFNIEKAFKDAKEETKFDIPEKYKNQYRDFFARRKKELENAYKKIYQAKEEEIER